MNILEVSLTNSPTITEQERLESKKLRKEYLREYQKKLRKNPEHRKKMQEYMKVYFRNPKNKKKLMGNHKRWIKENKLRWREIQNRGQKKYHDTEYGRIATNNRMNRWREKNRKYHLKQQKKWRKKRYLIYKKLPKYRIEASLRNRFRKILKAQKVQKKNHAIQLLGCDINFFKKYVAKKFKPGMSWDNWNLYSWHLDHIRPCSSFDLTKEEEQKRCFHYTNLQPLWATENLKKSNKIIERRLYV